MKRRYIYSPVEELIESYPVTWWHIYCSSTTDIAIFFLIEEYFANIMTLNTLSMTERKDGDTRSVQRQ